MPQYSFQPPLVGAGPQAHAQAAAHFQHHGPCVNCEIHIPDALAQSLTQQNIALPPPIAGTGLIDTGASISGIDENFAQRLGLQPINTISVSTPAGDAVQNLYGVKIEFPGTPLPVVPFLIVTGSSLASQGIALLIGRDYLADKVLIYNGPMRLYTVCF